MANLQLKRLCYILLVMFTLLCMMLFYQMSQVNKLCHISNKLIEENAALKIQLIELGVEPVTDK